MNEKTVKNRDMTSGPLLSRIVLFVLPLVATNLLQVLYNAADMVVVSLSTAPGLSERPAHLSTSLSIFSSGFPPGPMWWWRGIWAHGTRKMPKKQCILPSSSAFYSGLSAVASVCFAHAPCSP